MPKISQQQKDTVKAEILVAAKSVFMRNGYEATTMKDIVSESGRSFGGVYMYYSNKESLFFDLLKHQYESMAERFKAEETSGSWAALVQFLNVQMDVADKVEAGLAPCMYEFFIVGRKDQLRKEMIEARHAAIYDSISRLIQSGIQSGEFRSNPSVPVLSHFLISFLDGVFLESIITGHDRIRMREQFEVLKQMLKSALLR